MSGNEDGLMPAEEFAQMVSDMRDARLDFIRSWGRGPDVILQKQEELYRLAGRRVQAVKGGALRRNP